MKRQLAAKGIAFEALDNGILSCTEPKRLQAICDGLSAERGAFGGGALAAGLHARFLCLWSSGLVALAHPVITLGVTMLDDVEGLRALVAVADLGTFSAAGRALRLSTNAVSHRVARLEKRLGARLFERTTRLVRSTDAGDRLLLRARRVLEELELAEREVAVGNLEGTVRVALPPDLAGPTLMSALARVMAASPSLRLELLGRFLAALDEIGRAHV